MGRCEKLLEAARTNPQNLRFEELCQLAECHGFVPRGGKGSHRVYKGPGGTLPLQTGSNGKAKVYQVKQLLSIIDNE
jgi:hypothetical protein